jgi:LysR family transcriptional regulator, glycine cleavage system transcriptional activator
MMPSIAALDQSSLNAQGCRNSTALKGPAVRLPNLNSLRMFDAAARHLTFRAAAEELNLTQGAVAQQVRALEERIGLHLFDRKPRGLSLTPVGREYHVSVHRALELIETATNRLLPETARITLSVTPSLASKWLVPRLARFAAQHPEINLSIVASERLADFASDGVDLAIRQGRGNFAAGLQETLIAKTNLCAVTSPAFAASIEGRTVADFIDQKLIQDGHNFWDELFASNSLVPKHRVMQLNQTALAMDAAANGQGIALAPMLLATDDIVSGKLVPLWRDTRVDVGGFYLVHPVNRRPNPAREKVKAWVLAEVG